MNESTTIAATYSLVGARKIMDELAVAGGYIAFSMGELSVIYMVSTLDESTYLEIQCLGGRKFGVVKTIHEKGKTTSEQAYFHLPHLPPF